MQTYLGGRLAEGREGRWRKETKCGTGNDFENFIISFQQRPRIGTMEIEGTNK